MSDENQLEDLAVLFLQEMFLDARKKNKVWSKITKQSPQLDSGYIAQHLVSLLSGIPGDNRRGKGLDLSDGSEVKSASIIDGIDIPRWNHNFARPSKVDEWLRTPYIFYVLFDYILPGSDRVRFRMWIVNPKIDIAYSTVLTRWRDIPARSTNFQLHPPVNRNSNIGTNENGNLELPLVFDAIEDEDGTVKIIHMDINMNKTSNLINR